MFFFPQFIELINLTYIWLHSNIKNVNKTPKIVLLYFGNYWLLQGKISRTVNQQPLYKISPEIKQLLFVFGNFIRVPGETLIAMTTAWSVVMMMSEMKGNASEALISVILQNSVDIATGKQLYEWIGNDDTTTADHKNNTNLKVKSLKKNNQRG